MDSYFDNFACTCHFVKTMTRSPMIFCNFFQFFEQVFYKTPLVNWYYSALSQHPFICSKSTIETPEQCAESVQSRQQRHQNDVKQHLSAVFIANFVETSQIVLVFSLLNLNK